MNPSIEVAAEKSLDRTIGNILGGLAVADMLFLWAFFFFSPTDAMSYFFLARRIIALFVFSILLPPFAAWKSSRLWLLMLLNPLAIFTLSLISHP
jgi:hypothetical protein